VDIIVKLDTTLCMGYRIAACVKERAITIQARSLGVFFDPSESEASTISFAGLRML
jgi:hypothetical protein